MPITTPIDTVTLGMMSATAATTGPVVSRVLMHVWPTPLETAQLASIHATLDLQRQRLEHDRSHAALHLAEQRNLQLLQFQQEERMQTTRLRHVKWPLSVLAEDMILTAARHAAGGHQPLTVIVRTTGAGLPAGCLAAVNGLSRVHFEGGLVYCEATHPALQVGQSLASTLYAPLFTEACALIEISRGSESTLNLKSYFWGWQGDGSDGVIDHSRPISIPILEQQDRIQQSMEAIVGTLIALYCDTYRIWRTLGSPEPIPLLVRHHTIPDLSLSLDSPPGLDSETSSLPAFVLGAIVGTLNHIAEKAPLFAADYAAQAAISLHPNNPMLADSLVDHALSLLTRDGTARLANCERERRILEGGPTKLREALVLIRNRKIAPEARPKSLELLLQEASLGIKERSK